MQDFKENAVALLGAVLVCGALLAVSTIIVIWDVSSFRETVERMLAVDFLQAPPPATHTQQQAIVLAGRQIVGESAGLFARQPDTPEAKQLLPENLPSPIAPGLNLPAQATFGLSIPEAGLPELAGIEVRKGGGGGEVDVLAIRRSLPGTGERYATVSSTDKSRTRLSAERPDMLATRPSLPEQPAPAQAVANPQVALSDGNFILPGLAGPILRDLVAFRPAEGYPSLEKEIAADFSVERTPEGNFFRLSFYPRPQSTLPVIPKDVLFLVDVSQSMRTEQIRDIRDAIVSYVSQMRPEDRWNVVKFSERNYSLTQDFSFLAPSELNPTQVMRFVGRINNEYMTDLFDATQVVLRRISGSERPCHVFLLSDGMPTYRVWDIRKITEGFTRMQRENFSIFTFMAGDGGKPDLLRLLSYRSRGIYAAQQGERPLTEQILNFFLAWDRPVLASCVASYTNLVADDVYPEVLPNLYHGQRVTFHGRVENPGEFVVRVLGLAENSLPREFFFRPQGQPAAGRDLKYEWAMGRAYGLVEDILGAADEAQRLAFLAELREFMAQQNLTELHEMLRMLERNR